VVGGQLWRIAKRNAKRHRAQAIAAAAAVAVGTMVLSASLLAGQAAEGGIREVAFDVLGETDETVQSEGDFYVPEAAADSFRDAVNERRSDLAVSPAATHVAVARASEGLTEPEALTIGYPPGEQGFGSFDAAAGSAQLSGEGVLVNQRLAEPLDLGVGDELELRYSPPVDPLVPEIHRFDGNVTSAGSASPLPVEEPAAPEPAREAAAETFTFDVGSAEERIVAVLGWGSPENSTDLDLALRAPNGTVYENTNGSTGAPDTPAFLNATASEGTWQAEVRAEAAVDQPFRLLVVTLRPAYDLDELREGRQSIQQLGGNSQRLAEGRTTQTRTVTVEGIVTGEGKGGFTGEPAAFFALPQLQSLLDREDEVNLVRISNPGGPREGLEATEEVMPVLQAALDDTKADSDQPSVQALGVEDSKRQVVDRAEEAGSQFTRFLTTLSSFTIVAGVLLVVNLFTMLGEERRVEMSVMRALGTQRGHLVAAIGLEGLIYALPGVPVGAVAGLGLAYVLVQSVNEFVIGPDSLPIPFVVDWGTVLTAAGIGLAITMVAVLLTGVRLSRLNIASGLKDRRDPAGDATERWPPWVGLAGLALCLAYLPTGFYTLLLLGVSALLAAGAWRLTRSLDTRVRRFLASAPIVAYGLWTVLAFDDVSAAEGAYLAPIRGVLLVIAAVVAVLNTPGLPRLLKGLARRARSYAPAGMVAVSYPTRKQLRTGLTASMFGLVILVLIFFSTFFTVFEVDPAREAGGYDIHAETRLPVDDLEAWADENLDEEPASLDAVDRSHELPRARVVGGNIVEIDGQPPEYNGPPIDVFYGVTPEFAAFNDYELAGRQEDLTSDREAYRTVQQDTDTAIVSRVYDVDEAGRLGRIDGGERLDVDLGGRSVNFTVIGAQRQQYLGGIFVHEDQVRELFPAHGTSVLVTVEEGQDPSQVADQLETDFQDLGLNAEDIRQQAVETQQQNARFYTVLQVFLGIGLVIGVASLGIVTAKAALEREHELGVMRAMGVPREHVTASLVGEALLTAILGIVPGLAVGIAAAYAAWLAFFADAGAAFSIPWTSIAILVGISLAATVASTIPPARKAAKKNTAKAVRVRR
jgi:putative ABC transport system permease protein